MQQTQSRNSDRGRAADAHFRTMSAVTICTAVLSWLLLGVYRGFIVDSEATAGGHVAQALTGILASHYDLLFVMVLTLVVLALLHFFRSSRAACIGILVFFYLINALTLVWGFANINLVKILGEPFTYQWLVYGDFLQNADARNAMSDAFNLRDFTILSLSIVLVLALGGVFAWLWLQLGATGHRVMLGVVAVGVGLAALGTGYHVHAAGLPASKLQNPIVTFVESALMSPTPVVMTMPANSNDPALASVGDRPAETSRFKAPAPNPVKNVLLFIMESVPAKYVEPFGGQYPVTPSLNSEVDSSVRFARIYAHAPSTNYTLFSLFSSIYNDISYSGMTSSNPHLKLDSLSNTLSAHGFRTGFFWSADSRFQHVDEFLLNKGLDIITDYRGQQCATPVFKISTESFPNADYGSDICTAATTLDWINKDPDKPFLAMMFTAMTHYPYQVTASPDSTELPGGQKLVHYSDDEKFNSYLNALRIGDAALGDILEALRKSGRLDSTLVVVMGDHGEAFGEHENYGHASALYEENVHIPLMMINPQLFHGEVDQTLGGVIDIAPTILDILGIPLPKQWQGHSLFSQNRPERTFFFAPWRGVQFGYRENDKKVIFNGTTGKIEEYDLASDPGERSNLFRDGADQTAILGPIANWVQTQRPHIAQLIAQASIAAPGCGIDSIEVDAAGTSHEGAPRFQLVLDGKVLSEFEVPGPESTARVAKDSIKELKAAAAGTRTFKTDVAGGPSPQAIEVRYINDSWGGPDKPGDRNIFIREIRVNGRAVPRSDLHPDENSHGYTDDTGTALYSNGSLWVTGPFIPGCK